MDLRNNHEFSSIFQLLYTVSLHNIILTIFAHAAQDEQRVQDYYKASTHFFLVYDYIFAS